MEAIPNDAEATHVEHKQKGPIRHYKIGKDLYSCSPQARSANRSAELRGSFLYSLGVTPTSCLNSLEK
ncbi:hypothetical protein J53TS2_29940 [Paenibacillus sp. J53TS2]|nr:hypothetical protein J53TS2_29940 [Paenibacillus sp. J53TS2]